LDALPIGESIADAMTEEDGSVGRRGGAELRIQIAVRGWDGEEHRVVAWDACRRAAVAETPEEGEAVVDGVDEAFGQSDPEAEAEIAELGHGLDTLLQGEEESLKIST
jgi:hypothetical protein